MTPMGELFAIVCVCVMERFEKGERIAHIVQACTVIVVSKGYFYSYCRLNLSLQSAAPRAPWTPAPHFCCSHLVWIQSSVSISD